MIPGHEQTRIVQARVLGDGKEVWPNPAYDDVVAIDRDIHESARDDFDYDQPLDEDEVAAFVQRIGANTDGIRD